MLKGDMVKSDLIGKIEELVEAELKKANEQSPLFASDHEAYAFLLEEMQCASEAIDSIDSDLCTMWQRIKVRQECTMRKQRIVSYALFLAMEAVQIAAMAKKAIDSEKARKEAEECKEE